MSLVYIEKIPSNLRTAFENTVKAICSDLGIKNPDWLMIVMWAESRLNPQARNPKGTATGLIQFLESKNYVGNYYIQYFKNNVQTLSKLDDSDKEIRLKDFSTPKIKVIFRD